MEAVLIAVAYGLALVYAVRACIGCGRETVWVISILSSVLYAHMLYLLPNCVFFGEERFPFPPAIISLSLLFPFCFVYLI